MGAGEGEGSQHRASPESSIIDLEIEDYDNENMIRTLGIGKLIVFNSEGEPLGHLPPDADLEQYLNELRQLVHVIRALLDPKPWMVLRIGSRILAVVVVEAGGEDYYVAAEMINERLIDILSMTSEFLRDYIGELLKKD